LPGSKARFFLRRPDGRGGWINDANGVDTSILYRIDEVNEAIALGYEIAVVEGEKDADNLWRLDIPATCNAHGASEPGKKPKWTERHSAQLRGAPIVVFNDNDRAGYDHADVICRLSQGVAKRVRRLDLKPHWPDMPKGADVSDWLAAGHTHKELDALIAASPVLELEPGGDPEPTELGFSDDALALIFIDQHHENLRHVAIDNQWLFWTGCRWIKDRTLAAYDLVRDLCRKQAPISEGSGRTIRSKKTIAAVEGLARSDRRIAVEADQFDADGYSFHMPT
jgi:hypothetical protein